MARCSPEALLELIKGRRSIREFTEEPIPEDVLMDILEAGRWAPTGLNAQPWHFILVTEKGKRMELARSIRAFGVKLKHAFQCPAMVVLCADTKKSPKFSEKDVTLAGENMILLAEAHGIGSCWIGAFNEEKVKQTLGIPKGIKVVGILTLGRYRKKPDPPPKLPLTKVLHRESWRGAPTQNILDRTIRSGPISVIKRVFSAIKLKG